MDDAGNILVRRYSKSGVYVKSTACAANEETAIGAEVLKSPNQGLEHDKVMKVSWRLFEFCFTAKYWWIWLVYIQKLDSIFILIKDVK